MFNESPKIEFREISRRPHVESLHSGILIFQILRHDAQATFVYFWNAVRR